MMKQMLVGVTKCKYCQREVRFHNTSKKPFFCNSNCGGKYRIKQYETFFGIKPLSTKQLFSKSFYPYTTYRVCVTDDGNVTDHWSCK